MNLDTMSRLSCLKMKDTVPEVGRMTNHHYINNIRKWIHRFNKHGIEGKKHNRFTWRKYQRVNILLTMVGSPRTTDSAFDCSSG